MFPRSPSPSKQASAATTRNIPGVHSGSKTLSARAVKQRPNVRSVFTGEATTQDSSAQVPSRSLGSSNTLSVSKQSPKAANSSASSAALRQQIAAAKAAARKQMATTEDPLRPTRSASREHSVDGMNMLVDHTPEDEKHVLRNRINTARMDGRLNIAAMNLKQVPSEVMKMYDAAAMEDSHVSWAEVVDLTRLNAADNFIEELGEDVFPDVSTEDLAMDDEAQGNQFGGLELLDLHGNQLRSIPIGLRRLERLTTLTLSHNKLENDALDVISQISTLRDLRLGHNALSGNLPSTLCSLPKLESLDVQANRLLALPQALLELVSLKVLNVSGNQLTTLPMDAIGGLPLRELDASGNALIGSLFPPAGCAAHPTLQTLKVANNSLAALTFSDAVDLPQLGVLDVTNNHITGLPNVRSWPELVTLMAGDNKIKEFPEGFAKLMRLRNVNFSSNELRFVDPEIARMDALESLVLTANPLRDKKFLTMSAADIKRDLRARLEPVGNDEEPGNEQENFQDARDSFSPSFSSPRSLWTMEANGRLDLSGKALGDDINDGLGAFLQGNDVKQLLLSSNKLTTVPPALWLGQELRVLDLSSSTLCRDFLSDDLELPSLQELHMRSCNLSTLDSMSAHLQAPKLQKLDIGINRLSGSLPKLRQTYPALTTLIANDNRFVTVTPEALRGLQMVNLSSNDIDKLPAEVGLLWDEGLRNLDVSRNAFRVPNHRLLDKGTEAVMRYLRDRIPEADKHAVVDANEVSV